MPLPQPFHVPRYPVGPLFLSPVINRAGEVVPRSDPGIVAYVAQDPTAQYIVAGEGALANGGRQTMATRPPDTSPDTLRYASSRGCTGTADLGGSERERR